ncbi:MFS transporter [Krasilnikovia sp. MM14-A1004]|uniref:MFS transporter n=1 Tax=Krasilnikovia sp. MM14-A1004 TaxID=3373541 RepID=UPI00399C6AC1
MLIDALEVSALIVAVPAIGADLRVSPAWSQWLISGFALGFGTVLWLGPRIVDRFGRRGPYLVAVAVFAIVSLLSGVVSGLPALVALRFVKGCCAALTATTGVALISSTFAQGRARDRALSVYTLFGASGFSAGLVLSGVLTAAHWRWTLVSAAPVAAVLYVVAARSIPADPPRVVPRARLRELVAHPNLVRVAVVAGTLNGSYWALLFVLSLYLQRVRGWSPALAGPALLPASLPLAVSALSAGRLVRRVGAARLVAAGTALPPAGYLLVCWRGPDAAYPTVILPALLLVGAGFVLSFTALHVRATEEVPDAFRREATALYQSAVQLLGALSVITVAALVALPAAHRAALSVVVVIGTAGFVTALVRRGARPDGSAN